MRHLSRHANWLLWSDHPLWNKLIYRPFGFALDEPSLLPLEVLSTKDRGVGLFGHRIKRLVGNVALSGRNPRSVFSL